MEFRIHVHRIHRIYIHDGILDYLDWSWLDGRPNRCMDLALQVHSTGSKRKRCPFSFLSGFRCNGFPRGKTCCCSFCSISSSLCCSPTNQWRKSTLCYAWMVRSNWYSNRICSSRRILLCRRDSSFYLDRCRSIECHDNWFKLTLLCCFRGSWWIFRIT